MTEQKKKYNKEELMNQKKKEKGKKEVEVLNT